LKTRVPLAYQILALQVGIIIISALAGAFAAIWQARQELDRQYPLDVMAHLPQMHGSRRAHRDVILLAGAGGDRVGACGMHQHLVLAHEAGGHVLRDHEARVQAAVGGQERREAV